MAFSRDTYTSSGEATYTITFPYLDAGHVNLFVNGVSKTYTLDSATVLRPDVTPTSGDTVLITRTSNQSARLVDYVDASVFKADTLDDDILQSFYVSQEALDNASELSLQINAAGDEWDAESKEISNVLGGTDSNDAVAYGQMVNYVAAAAGVPDPTTFANKALVSNGSTVQFGDLLQYNLNHDLNSAAVGPTIIASRTRGAGTATANDLIGAFESQGEDDGGNATTYAVLEGEIIDPTDTSEDGRWNVRTTIAGTLADRFHFGHGLYAAGNSDPGAGGIDADALLISGVGVPMEADNNTWTGLNVATFEQWTDAATVTADFSGGNNFYVTVTASRTIGAPSGDTNGQSGFIIVEMDGTGGHTTSWNAAWLFKDGITPAEDTGANQKNAYAYYVDWDGEVHISYIGAF